MSPRHQPLPCSLHFLCAFEIVVGTILGFSGGFYLFLGTMLIFFVPSVYVVVKVSERKLRAITCEWIVAVFQSVIFAMLILFAVINDIDDAVIDTQRYPHFYAYLIGGTALFLASIRFLILSLPSTKNHIRQYFY